MLTAEPRVWRAEVPGAVRTAAWIALAAIEVLAISLLFDFKTDAERYYNPVFYALAVLRWMAATVPVLALLLWADRRTLADAWQAARAHHDARRALVLNVVLFAALAFATFALTRAAAAAASPPWSLFVPYLALLAATGLSILRLDIGLRALVAMATRWRRPLLAAMAIGLLTVLMAELALLAWPLLAPATLHLTASILALYEPGVVVDEVARTLRVGNFRVTVHEACSGYEGLALILVFVAVYLAAFRKLLRFPAAFFLFPIGLASIWLLNSVRIAALLSFGAHVSPSVAAKGFHSQAGWIVFVIVAVGLMAASRAPVFSGSSPQGATGTGSAAPATTPNDGAPPSGCPGTLALLLPFVALMLGSIFMAAAAPRDNPAYIVKVVAVAAALLVCRNSYPRWSGKVSLLALAAGLAVGVIWAATATATARGHHLGLWLVHIGPAFAVIWLLARGLGTILLVPIAEELAFRSYLYRRLIAARIETVSLTRFSPLAFLVSTLLFAALHDRWLAAALAGAVFACLMIRKGRLADAIVAHAAANAVIFFWAVAARQWSLL